MPPRRSHLKRSFRYAAMYVTGCASDLATAVADVIDQRHVAARRSWWRHLPEQYRTAYLQRLSSLGTFRAAGRQSSDTFVGPTEEADR
jgi:predicted transcriptional regulator